VPFFGARHPVVQAPMAYVQPPSLAAAASNAGALGTIAGTPLGPDELRLAIREVRAATAAPFGVNLFAPPYLGDGQLEVVLEERPAVFSFTFGLVEPALLHDEGIAVLGTATTAEEAALLEAAGVDGVVLQAAEAGGHRGTFLGSFDDGLVPLEELLQMVDVAVPVIAAGGIVDRADVRRAHELGAAGVQVGTAFLFTPECAVPPAHLEALRTYETVVTAAYTGRPMRAARTPVLEELMAGPPPLPFPQQRAVSARLGPVFMGGTGARRAREQSVAELVRVLADAWKT
jgi:nitronate monooxygenase